MAKTLSYNANKGCPAGYRHRRGYTSKKGKYVEPRCVKAQSIYPEGVNNLRESETQKARRRLKGVAGKLGLTKHCPKGYILRAPYKRKFSSTVKKQGFNAKRGGKTVRIYPKANSVVVKAQCVKDLGLPGKGPRSGEGIAPLREGELSKYGYKDVANLNREQRRAALKKAIAVYGALGVFRKLDAIAKLTLRTAPDAHTVFAADRDWVKKNYSLKAF